jgi:hypothetical protein
VLPYGVPFGKRRGQASGGYPWTIIPLQRRDLYMAALESASVGGDIKPFAQFLASLIGNTGPPR